MGKATRRDHARCVRARRASGVGRRAFSFSHVVSHAYLFFCLFSSERRYRALTQVAAHPHAERLAYRTGAHLRAYYQHVYDCLENPPRLNFTKMLRWLTETDRQNALRAQYYASHHEHDDVHANHHTHTHTHTYEHGNNARSNGSSSRVNLSSSQRSIGSGRTRSISSHRHSRDDVLSPQKQIQDLVVPRRGWKYTVEDIQAFRDSGGVVNYFVPPRQIHPYNDEINEQQEAAETERSASPQTIANRVEHDLNRNYFGRRTATPPQSHSRDLFDHSRDDNSSAAGSSKKGHPHDFSQRTPNNTPSNVSLVDMDQNIRETNLSRSTSFDTGGDKSATGKGDHRVNPIFFFSFFFFCLGRIFWREFLKLIFGIGIASQPSKSWRCRPFIS